MEKADVIIVGGGPAGASCAQALIQAGLHPIILDKREFPRPKLCAGWITPRVFNLLGATPEDYPHPLTRFRRLRMRFHGIPFTPPTRQYAIRRYEFDAWLLRRSGAQVRHHRVEQITENQGDFVVDGMFSAPYIVGAGGTQCPVARSLFSEVPPAPSRRIVTLEEEFVHQPENRNCYLWFFQHRLPGYAWYVPKEGGYLAVGVGGLLKGMQQRGSGIREHWNLLTERLERSGLLVGRSLHPAGHSYFLRGARGQLQRGRAFLTGDAAGLATRDMGEGIAPAIHSGIRAARAIAGGQPYSAAGIGAYSLRDIAFPPKTMLSEGTVQKLGDESSVCTDGVDKYLY